jgi:hypothetical protein
MRALLVLLVACTPADAGPEYHGAAATLSGVTPSTTGLDLLDCTSVEDCNRSLAEGTQTLTDGATVNWDVSLGRHALLTVAGNRTLANPTNLQAGEEYDLTVTMDSTGNRVFTFGSTFSRAAQYKQAPNAVSTIVWRYDGTKLRVVSESKPTSYSIVGLQDTNMAAGETVPFGTPAVSRYIAADTSAYTEYRITCTKTVAGATNAVAGWQYSSDNTTFKYLDNTASGSGPGTNLTCPLVSTGPYVSSWAAMHADSIGTARTLRGVAYLGDGVADPAYSLGVELR